MSPELDKKLCQQYPIIYRDRSGKMTETLMVWGFSCGDGWYDLLNEASAKLEAIAQKQPLPVEQNQFQKLCWPYVDKLSGFLRNKRPVFRVWPTKNPPPEPTVKQKVQDWFKYQGWSQFVPDWYWLNFVGYFQPAEDERLAAVQVKEKFGILRIYTNYTSDEIDTVISDAEKRSEATCEDCGEPGCLRNVNHWMLVRCDKCYEEYCKLRKV